MRLPWVLSLGLLIGCAEPLPGVSASRLSLSAEPGEASQRLRGEVADLVSEGERSVRRPHALERAASMIESRLGEAGWSVTRQPITTERGTAFNIMTEAPRSPYRLIGAHYDSARRSPGGNDNASGVAVLLALAERFGAKSARRPLRLVFFANEEPPFFGTAEMGSRVFVERAQGEGVLPTAAIVLDSVGRYTDEADSQRFPSRWLERRFGHRGNSVAFVGDEQSENLLRASIGIFRSHASIPSRGAALSPRLAGAGWSDHASFWRAGIPAILVTDTATFRDEHYHRRSDDGAQINFHQLAQLLEGLEAVGRMRRLD